MAHYTGTEGKIEALKDWAIKILTGAPEGKR
jgi:hypothetical protein